LTMSEKKLEKKTTEPKVYEKPKVVWEDDFKAVTYAPISCAKMPLQSYMCDSRPTW